MKEFRVGEPGGGETRHKHNARKHFNPLAWQMLGSVSTILYFVLAASGGVHQKSCRDLSTVNPTLKHVRLLSAELFWVKDMNLKQNLATLFRNISHLHPPSLHLSSVSFDKSGEKNTEKQSYFPPCQDEWPIAGGREWRRSSQSSCLKCAQSLPTLLFCDLV